MPSDSGILSVSTWSAHLTWSGSAPLVHRQEQLDVWRVQDLLGRIAGGERVEAVQKDGAERVRRVQDRRLRAEIAPEGENVRRSGGARLAPALAEDLEIGIAEPVDGLVLVADREELGVGAAEGFDELQLDAVRVLELVDHDVEEPPAPEISHLLGGRQHLDGEELEVREVESGPRGLELGVAAVGLLEHGVERVARADRVLALVLAEGPLLLFLPGRASVGSETAGRRGCTIPWLRRRSCAIRVIFATRQA